MAEEIGALRAVLALESAAFDRGVQSARRQLGVLEGGLNNTARQVQRAGVQIERQASAFNRLGRSAQGGAGGIQNFGYQIQDFAVQVGAGTSAAQALGQQLPQLLSGFGTLGIIMGTAAAVAIPLGAALLGLGGKVGTLKDALDGVNTALQGTSDLAKIAKGDLDGLQERYGQLTPEVMRLVEAQNQVGLRELADASRALNEQLTALYNGNAWLNVGRAEDLANGLNLNTRASRELANSMQQLARTDDFATQLAIVSQMRERFVEMVGPVDQMTARQRDFYFALVDSESKMRELKARTDLLGGSVERLASPLEVARFLTAELADAASGLAGYFASADSAVAGLANTLAQAASNAWDLAQARISAEQRLEEIAFGNSPGGRALNMYGSRAPGGTAAQNALAERNAPVTVSGRGGGGGRRGGGGRSSALSETARLAAAEIENLDTKISEVNRAAEEMDSTLGSAFVDLVTGAKSFSEALSEVASQLARMLAQSAFDGLFGRGGGLLSGLFGGGGRVAAFASGGVVNGPTLFPMANGAGLMGEAGPEAIMPLTRIGGKLGVRAAGGGTVINVDARYASEGTADMIVRALREAAPGIVRQAVGASRGAAARGY